MDNNRLSGYFLSRLSEKEVEELCKNTVEPTEKEKEQALEQMDIGIYDAMGNLVGEIDTELYRTLEERNQFRVRYLQRFGYTIPEDLRERVGKYGR